jgi:CheY-like chemotaxis protein
MTKILLIENEKTLREEVSEWLHLEGFQAFDAKDGQEGLELIRSEKPDLIICDITMPIMDGYAVLEAVRADPETRQIPFIFVTAKASQDDIRHGLELSVDRYITKPFTLADLLEAIDTLLGK